MIRHFFPHTPFFLGNTCRAILVLAAFFLLIGQICAAREISALPPDPARFTVEIHLLTVDARMDLPLVWMDRGAAQDVQRGDKFHVFHNGVPVGTLTVDTVLHVTCAGTLEPVTDYTGPLFDAAFEAEKIAPISEALLVTDFAFSPALDAPLSLTGIRAPKRGANIMSQPWRAEYDTDLDALFRSIAESRPVSGNKPPLPPISGPLPLATTSVMPTPDPAPLTQAGFRMRILDPDMARDIKSGFFVEPGDCIHISPWPERTDGFFVEISEDQTLTFPGPEFVSTNGKSLLRLEKEIGNLPAFAHCSVFITPCVRDTSPTAAAHPR